MSSQTLLDNFETIAEAPGGIECLKQLILNLALRGSLTPVVSGNTPNERVADLDVPAHWDVVRFPDYFDLKGGGQPPKSTFVDSARPNYVRLFQIRDYGPNPVPTYIPEHLATKKSKRGEILLARYGASGKVFWAEDGAYNVALAKLVYPVERLCPEFAFLLFKSPWFQRAVRSTTRVAVDGFNKSDLKHVVLPIPPIAEQLEIVRVVSELTSFCDQLEAAKEKRDSLRTAARKSAIDAISTAATAIEFKTAWERISDKWITFSDSPESLDELRFLILEIALSGRLTPHDKSWNKCRLGDLTKIRTGKLDANASSIDGKYPFFTCAKDPLRISTFSYDTECVLLAGNGNFDVNYYSGKFDAYQRTYIIESQNPNKLDVRFLFRYMQRHSRTLLAQSIGGVIKYIRIGFLTEASILVPSISTQKEVVSRIDALMKICDDLENMLEERSALSEKLLAGLGQLNPPAA